MIGNLKPYHPSAILQQKREKQAELIKQQLETASTQSTASAGADSSTPAAPPPKVKKEGLAGILQHTMDYLDEGLAAYGKLEQKFTEMVNTLNQTLDIKLDDQDRKKIHKDFITQKKTFDEMVKTLTVGGEPFFSGKFSQKGKSLKIGLSDEESVVLRQAPLFCENIGIARTRVDSLVNARKALPAFDKAKLELDEAKKSLKARTETVSFKQAKIENAEKMNDESENSKVKFASLNTDLDYYRIMQKKMAEQKGRESALLLNIRI